MTAKRVIKIYSDLDFQSESQSEAYAITKVAGAVPEESIYNVNLEGIGVKSISNAEKVTEGVLQGFATLSVSGVRKSLVQATQISRKEIGELKVQKLNAEEIAENLSKKYKVSIIIVPTDQEYFEDSTIRKNVRQEATYYISEESLELTSKITDYVLRREQIRRELFAESGRMARTEKSLHNALDINQKIDEIKENYQKEHEGKTPNVNTIAKILTEQGVESPSGKSKWFAQTVKRILEAPNRVR